MPTALRRGPYRVFFYSGDCSEPPHMHVERDENVAKFWLSPVRLHSSGGFGRQEIGRILRLLEDNSKLLARSWDEHCGG